MELGPYGLPMDYLERVVDRAAESLNELSGKKIVILGGTGFIGSWLCASLAVAQEMGFCFEVIAVSRSRQSQEGVLPPKFRNSSFLIESHDLAHEVPSYLVDGDCFLIAATSTSIGNEKLLARVTTAETISNFLREVAKYSSQGQKNIVHLSSGAVYEAYQKTTHPLVESGAPTVHSEEPYIQSKLIIEETLKALKFSYGNLRVSNPRLFAFYGPRLPLNAHFAIGNFMSSALEQSSIRMLGNPSTTRSYLHIADLAVALLKLMARPIQSPINIGSAIPTTMLNLAEEFCEIFSLPGFKLPSTESCATFYVPEILNAEANLGRLETIEFRKGICDWHAWCDKNQD